MCRLWLGEDGTGSERRGELVTLLSTLARQVFKEASRSPASGLPRCWGTPGPAGSLRSLWDSQKGPREAPGAGFGEPFRSLGSRLLQGV